MPIKAIKPFISVIIPCYNEEKNLERGKLDEVSQYLADQDYSWEVIIINDGSTDNSENLIKRFIENRANFFLIDIPHGGKPAAIWTGIQEANGGIVLFTDMDQSTPIDELNNLLPWFEKSFDVVIGSRGTKREGFSIIRTAGSFVFRNIRRLFLLRNINDTQCGFKSCRRKMAMEIFPRLHYFKQTRKPVGWKVTAYDVELLYVFKKAGYKIKEMTVKWEDRDLSDTKSQKGKLIQYVNESIEMTNEVVRVKLNQIKGLYDEVDN